MLTLLDFLHALPKAELHCHLLGTVRQDTFAELARREKAPLDDAEIQAFYTRGEKPVGVLRVLRAGAATEIPLPASVFIALPAVTQLLTSGPASKASSRYTACGPPAMKATGISRPIAADGTIRVS